MKQFLKEWWRPLLLAVIIIVAIIIWQFWPSSGAEVIDTAESQIEMLGEEETILDSDVDAAVEESTEVDKD